MSFGRPRFIVCSMTTSVRSDTARTLVDQANRRLAYAQRSGSPCPPVRDLIGADAALAYAVQRAGIDDRLTAGARVVGHKIGLTSVAVQAQLGVDQPDFGVLLDDMQVLEGGVVGPGRLLQPRVEAEVAFVLASDLAGPDLTAADVRAAVDHARVALEIVDSRIAGWDITFADTVADNGSSGMFVLGRTRLDLDEVEPAAVEMELCVDGAIASTGSGVACLGDPLAALLWLARTAVDVGDPLRAGQIVLSGALGPMVDAVPGSTVSARLALADTTIASVDVRFAADSHPYPYRKDAL